MTSSSFDNSATSPTRDPIAALRARAVADVRCLRALSRAAQTAGLPKADLRSANARAAARRILDHARRLSVLRPDVAGGLRPAEMAD